MNWQIDWQLAAATMMVAGCAGYALWPLLPAALRQRWRKALGLPARSAGGSCGSCDGCGSGPARGKPADAVIRVVRRPPG